jgi:hypothetical protein
MPPYRYLFEGIDVIGPLIDGALREASGGCSVPGQQDAAWRATCAKSDTELRAFRSTSFGSSTANREIASRSVRAVQRVGLPGPFRADRPRGTPAGLVLPYIRSIASPILGRVDGLLEVVVQVAL